MICSVSAVGVAGCMHAVACRIFGIRGEISRVLFLKVFIFIFFVEFVANRRV